jgi:MerR family transcriptional regulator/heat shock protein HspR
LRKYEREGLIAPSRTTGNLRLYSDEDLDRLRQVKYLVGERGLNLAGVQVALETTQRLRDLRDWLARQPEANEPTPRRLRDELGVLLESLGASGETARR